MKNYIARIVSKVVDTTMDKAVFPVYEKLGEQMLKHAKMNSFAQVMGALFKVLPEVSPRFGTPTEVHLIGHTAWVVKQLNKGSEEGLPFHVVQYIKVYEEFKMEWVKKAQLQMMVENAISASFS